MIDDGVVHVWRAPLDAGDASELHRALSAAERERAAAFLRERDGVHFSTDRGVLRHVLSQYTGSRPGELRLVVGAHGKPLRRRRRAVQLLALRRHRGGCRQRRSRRGHRRGADPRRSRLRRDRPAVLLPYREPAACGGGGPGARAELFRCWTLKEAVVKAAGFGLSLPLETFTVLVGDGIVTPEPGWPCSRPYVLRGFNVRSNCAAAVALEGEGVRVELHDFVPVSTGAQVWF